MSSLEKELRKPFEKCSPAERGSFVKVMAWIANHCRECYTLQQRETSPPWKYLVPGAPSEVVTNLLSEAAGFYPLLPGAFIKDLEEFRTLHLGLKKKDCSRGVKKIENLYSLAKRALK
jgi:hypothetical protein